jgi:type I restriction enzyme, S subunit
MSIAPDNSQVDCPLPREEENGLATQGASDMEGRFLRPFRLEPWPVMPLGEAAEIVSGLTLGRPVRGRATRQVPYLRVANVKDGSLDLSDVYKIEATQNEIEKCRLRFGDILLTEGGDADKVGRGTFWRDQIPECLHQNHIFRVRLPVERFCHEFVSFQFGSPYGKSYFFAHAKQTTGIATINRGVLNRFPLLAPPLVVQHRIAARLRDELNAVADARAVVKAQLETAGSLLAAQLRAIFGGQVARRWPRCKLGDLLSLRKEVVHPRDNPRGPAVFVGLEHIQPLTGRRLGSLPVETSELTGRKPRFYCGDIVYGYLRPYLNKLWVADFDGLCSVDQYVYEVNHNRAETDFVAWFMRSPVYLERAPIDTTPGQLPRIRTEEVTSVEINLPSRLEQKMLVAKMQKQFMEVTRLNESLSARFTSVDRLPAALLSEAFSSRI